MTTSDSRRESQSTSRLLERVESGDKEAEGALLELLFDELRGVAAGYLAGERAGHTLQPTALVSEAWMRLGGGRRSEGAEAWADRQHFVRTAARAMRRILVDHARARNAEKRGQRTEVADECLVELAAGFESQADVLALHESLERLAAFDEPLARLVELRFFAGLSVPEAARAVGRSVSHVERQWRLARAWLRRDLDV